MLSQATLIDKLKLRSCHYPREVVFSKEPAKFMLPTFKEPSSQIMTSLSLSRTGDGEEDKRIKEPTSQAAEKMTPRVGGAS